MAKKNYDLLFKLLLVGDSDTGKAALLFRFSEPVNTTFVSTIGMDFKLKTIELGGKKIKLQIWDTAGQERFQTVTTAYYRGAMGILLVYSITNQKTFDSIPKWVRNINEHATDVQQVLVGNNCEMEDERQVPREKGEQLAAQYGIPFFETSTVKNINVEKAFLVLAQAILEKRQETQEPATEFKDEATVDLGKEDEKSKCF